MRKNSGKITSVLLLKTVALVSVNKAYKAVQCYMFLLSGSSKYVHTLLLQFTLPWKRHFNRHQQPEETLCHLKRRDSRVTLC